MGEGSGRAGGPRTAYAAAGVDVEAGERAVDLLRASVERTRRPEVLSTIGGFGGAVRLPTGYREPLLVSSADGVGTKTALAEALHRFDTIGIDLVAMCADDVVCSGAEPLFFLDYVAIGRLVPEVVAEIVGGVAEGCRQAGCALVGGETAEHPGLMAPGAFDLAGFCVGVVDAGRVIDGRDVRAGDLIIGLAASGLHSNGFSLVRALLAEHDVDLGRPYQEQLERTLGDAAREAAIAREPERALATVGDVLLTPTRIYARAILSARRSLQEAGHDMRGLAHVTGGGLPGAVPRMLPANLGGLVDPQTWPLPSVMGLVGALGGLADEELRATFNGGIGMVLVVAPEAAADAVSALAVNGAPGWVIGTVEPIDALGGVRYAEQPPAGIRRGAADGTEPGRPG